MRFGGIAAMGDFWRVVREFNPEGIEREATAHLDLWLVGEPESGKRTLAEALMGAEAGSWVHGPFRFVDVDYQQGQLPQIDSPDLIVLVARLDRDLAEQARQAATIFRRRLRVPPLLVLTRADSTQRSRDERNAAYRAFSFVSHLKMAFVDTRDHREVQETVGPMLLEGVPSLRTALARQIPSLRRPVADQIIAETCRVNAQFALAANLPANLPFFGGVAGNVADFFVLTKNQVMLALRLGAVYGRDLGLTTRMAGEIAPVIGGGLLWRAAARMAVGMLPTLLAAAPKMTIAYVGTYVAGHAARYYFDEGRKPPRQMLEQFAAEGARLYRERIGHDGQLPQGLD
ncbi:MAG: hypothetical protein ACYC5J_05975 [Chloroflexota bacterium]